MVKWAAHPWPRTKKLGLAVETAHRHQPNAAAAELIFPRAISNSAFAILYGTHLESAKPNGDGGC
jgi:hypothetical protein